MDEAAQLVPADWSQGTQDRSRQFRPAIPDGNPDWNGHCISPEAVADVYRHHRMYPVHLASTLDADAALLLAAWGATSKRSYDPKQLPWVPVGTVGPVLILGHVAPEISEPPLPWNTFQAVCLRRDDYDRQLANVSLVMEGRALHEAAWNLEIGGGVGCFPPNLVMPTEKSSVVRFFHEYYLHRPEAANTIKHLVDRRDIPDDLLPHGYAEASAYLLGSIAVAQPINLKIDSTAQKRLPESLRKRITVINEIGHHLWLAALSLPQPEAEDRLYSELGEGWQIHWLLRAAEERPSTAARPPGAAGHSKGPFQDNSRAPFSSVLTTESAERVILLDEKEWSGFDPRKRRVEAADVWKWAIYKAIKESATDLHLEPGVNRTYIRQRIDGLLEPSTTTEYSPEFGEAMAYSLMTQCGIGSDRYRPLDGGFTVKITGRDVGANSIVRVRASAYPVRGTTQSIALRFLPKQGQVPALQDLVPPRAFKMLSRAISRPEGMILICGPTGSGKTTTIFSCMSLINTPDIKITTLENPVEYELEGTNQGEVNERRQVGWAELNKAFLRQDPDAGLIGEIRDEDTTSTILRAALTGHLVFGSLHTKSSPTAMIRLIDLGGNPNIVAETLLLIATQRLIRRVCVKCSETHDTTPEEKILYEEHNLDVPLSLRRARDGGCEECKGKGYKGRVAAVELLPNVPEVRRMIERRACSDDYIQWMRSKKLPDCFENALELAAAGLTSVAEALTLQQAWEGSDWTDFNADTK